MLLSFLLPCLCTVELRLDHLGSFRIVFFFFFFVLLIFFCFFLLYRNCTRGLASYAAVPACHARYIDRKSAVINFLSLGSVFGYTADTYLLILAKTKTLKQKSILISSLWFWLFVCNRGDTIEYHGGLRSRELGQAPMPYAPMLLVFLTPRQASIDGLTELDTPGKR